MKPTRYPAAFAAVLAMCSVTAHAGLDDLLKSAEGLLPSSPLKSAGGAGLSDSQIGAGLKEALSVGAERAVSLLGRSGGFLNDKSVRIPLPGVLGTAAKGLRAAGQGQYVDAFETTVNRAAEQAVPEAADPAAVADLGGDDAALAVTAAAEASPIADDEAPTVRRAIRADAASRQPARGLAPAQLHAERAGPVL